MADDVSHGRSLAVVAGETCRKLCTWLLIAHAASLVLCLNAVLDRRICDLTRLESYIYYFQAGMAAAFLAILLSAAAAAGLAVHYDRHGQAPISYSIALLAIVGSALAAAVSATTLLLPLNTMITDLSAALCPPA